MNGASVGYILGAGAMMFAVGYLVMAPFLIGSARKYRKSIGLPIAFLLTGLLAYASASQDTSGLIAIAWALSFSLLIWRILRKE